MTTFSYPGKDSVSLVWGQTSDLPRAKGGASILQKWPEPGVKYISFVFRSFCKLFSVHFDLNSINFPWLKKEAAGSSGVIDIENTLVDTAGESKAGMRGEQQGHIHTVVCETDSGSLPCDSGRWGRGLWQPRGVGWGGREQRGSTGRGHTYARGRLMLMYSRNRHNGVKPLSSN